MRVDRTNEDARSVPPRRTSGPPTASFADHLATHRERVLQAWQAAVGADHELASPDGLSRTEFRDHIPQMLDEFEASLRQEDGHGPVAQKPADADGPLEHGRHRWQQGYDLREVILELGHLHQCLLQEVESARAVLPGFTPDASVETSRSVANLIDTAIADSAEQYARLTQRDATNERNDLERTVARFTDDGEQRTELWREAAHDLRGQLSIITSATSLLEYADLGPALREEAIATLGKGSRSLKEMLARLLENAQSHAVREECRLDSFDAGRLLSGLCAALQPLARERGSTLRWKGPASLTVEGDRGKVQRIAQNLLLNALHSTHGDGVIVSWRENDARSWSFEVRDTGPGLPDGKTDPSGESEGRRYADGIGSTIVRRLSELLGARVDTATASGAGTVSTVTLPRRYTA